MMRKDLHQEPEHHTYEFQAFFLWEDEANVEQAGKAPSNGPQIAGIYLPQIATE